MGYNSTIIIINDALPEIEGDPEFGKALADAVRQMAATRCERVDVRAGNHYNAAAVIETHHADFSVVVVVGGNYGNVLATVRGWKHHEEADKVDILRKTAKAMGFDLVPAANAPEKPVPNAQDEVPLGEVGQLRTTCG